MTRTASWAPVLFTAGALLVAACSGGAATPTTTAAPTTTTTAAPAAPTTTTSTVPAALADPESCRLAAQIGQAVGLSWPRSEERLAATGDVDIALLFADYEDVPAAQTPDEVLRLLSPDVEEFFARVSYGRMNLVLHPHLEWLRLGRSADYAAAIRSFDTHRGFIQEAVDLADAVFDFAAMEEVVVIGNPNAALISNGPTWLGFDRPRARIEADGTRITNGITSGADLSGWGWRWLAHELGHSLGLPDLYALDGSGGFTRPFGIMDDVGGGAPEFFGYERWYFGWLDDDQILCLDGGYEATLIPIEVPGGVKAMMVPLSGSHGVVVESRRAVGYDARLATEGAVVYLVDVGIPTFEGPIRVQNDRRVLQAGESVAVEGVTITVTESSAGGDTVRITPGG